MQAEKAKRVVEEVPEVFSLERIEISETIMKELVKVMNEIHQVNYSYRFWKIIMGNYVNATVSIMHILKKEVLYNQYSLEAVNSHSLPTFKQQLIARLPSVIKHYKSFNALNTINKLLQQNNSITVGLPDIEVSKKMGASLPVYYPIYPGSGNTEKRKRANEIAEKYTDTFYKNMVLRLPKVYVEYFDKKMESIVLSEPATKTFHVHVPPTLFSNLLIAWYVENGAKLCWYQHGAYYGEMIGHNAHFHEASVSDEFHTWGWKIKSNDVPDAAFRLEKFKQQYDGYSKTGDFDFLMCYPDVYDTNREFYKKVTDHFLIDIDSNKYSSVLARPRPLNKMFSHAGRLSFITDKRVTIDTGLTPMTKVIAQSKLVIQFTVPATNFMECLYVDHPTVGLLQNDQPTQAIKPYYDFLLQQGVLHHNFDSLIKHLNSIQIEEWWAALIKEPMYLQFKNEFLRKV
ncbi:MAG: hypothetical protein IPP72_05355 [Chitinophagaceae bacterium]|nr:hypothetical protein [Chitinophagaceae bacterium]